jgi:hypothetical protein
MEMPLLGDPILIQVMKNLVQPHLGGKYEDWPKFVVDWETYLGKLSAGRKITDEQKLQLLEGCLNETDKNELQLMEKVSGGNMTFAAYWAKLVARYGEEQNTCGRRRWREIQLNNSGRVSSVEWRDFKVKFMDIWHDVPGANDEEAYQTVTSKLPPFIMTWVVEEQEKRKHRTPKVAIGPFQDVTPQDVLHTVQQWVGTKPRGIMAKGEGMYVIELGSETQQQALLALNGKKIRGGNEMKVQKMDQHLTVVELFDHVERKLIVRDKVGTSNRWGSQWGTTQRQRASSSDRAEEPEETPDASQEERPAETQGRSARATSSTPRRGGRAGSRSRTPASRSTSPSRVHATAAPTAPAPPATAPPPRRRASGPRGGVYRQQPLPEKRRGDSQQRPVPSPPGPVGLGGNKQS